MKIKNLQTDLFTLAEMQLKKDLVGGKISDYSMLEVINKAIIIRKELDRLNDKGKIKNYITGKIKELYSQKELRRMKYLRTGK
jgi:hypothetical protein